MRFSKDLFLLAVANGLSVERQQWPRFVRPKDVPSAPPTPVRSGKVTDVIIHLVQQIRLGQMQQGKPIPRLESGSKQPVF
jgi:hypothetical protein